MIEINKGTEPKGLAELREAAKEAGLSPKEAYKTLRDPLKGQVRDSLVNEQGALCAYCMCRIPRLDTPPDIAPIIIEHFIPRSPTDKRDAGQGLDYNNLLAVCHGNKARRGIHTYADLTCDAHRGNIEFKKINPCKRETLVSICYGLDGTIDASDSDVKYDLTETLNLNCTTSPLVAERKAALDSLIEEMDGVEEDDILGYCTETLQEFHEEKDNKTPYVGILIWYLQTTIDALSAA